MGQNDAPEPQEGGESGEDHDNSHEKTWRDRALSLLPRVRRFTYTRRWLSLVEAVLLRIEQRLLTGWQLDHERQRDTSRKSWVRAPEDELIQWPCFWAVEAFTPSQFRALPKMIRRAGWLDQTRPGRTRAEFETWLRELRGIPELRAWRHLVTIVDHAAERGMSNVDAHRERIPPEFERISVSAIAFSPSVTFIVARFDLAPNSRTILDSKLRDDAPARVVRKHGVRSVQSGDFRREAEVDETRAAIHRAGFSWLSKRLHGVFAEEREGRLSCLDLILTEAARPSDAQTKGRAYLSALDLNEFDSWRCSEFPRLTLHPRDKSIWDRSNRGDFTLAGRFDEILPDEMFEHTHNGRSLRAVVHKLEMYEVRSMAAVLALSSLLAVKEAATARTRDLARLTYGRRRIVRSNRELHRSILSGSLDVSSVAGDVAGYSAGATVNRIQWNRLLRFEVYGSNLEYSPRQHVGRDFWEDIADFQASKAHELRASDEQLRSILSVAASVSATIANTRLQRWSLGVATTSAVLAVLALIIGLPIFELASIGRFVRDIIPPW